MSLSSIMSFGKNSWASMMKKDGVYNAGIMAIHIYHKYSGLTAQN